MALFENFPYTNLHELNLDWLIQEMKELEQKVQDGPVVSVNGLTGVVTLYRESNIQFPDITDSTVTKWEMFRYLNGQIFGIQFDNNGNVYALRDFVRTKLLTWDDIPPEAGVISINDLYGVVHLSGTDIPYMGGETETVYDKLSDLDDDITSAQADINELSVTLTTVDNAIKRGIAYLESGDIAINNIPAGRYVFWKNGAYISTSAISAGDTLSTTNLSAVATGGFINALQAEINEVNSKLLTPTVINDADSAKETGFYSTSNSTTNTPYAGYFNIYVLKYGNNDVSQITIDINNNRMFTRTWHDGTTWTSWKEYVEGGSVSVSSVSFINFTGSASDYVCFRNGNVITLTFKFTIATSTSSNAQINENSLPLFGKTFRLAHGQWYDNTNDQSGDITGYYNSGIRFSRNGENTGFSDRVNHNMSVVITYIVS